MDFSSSDVQLISDGHNLTIQGALNSTVPITLEAGTYALRVEGYTIGDVVTVYRPGPTFFSVGEELIAVTTESITQDFIVNSLGATIRVGINRVGSPRILVREIV